MRGAVKTPRLPDPLRAVRGGVSERGRSVCHVTARSRPQCVWSRSRDQQDVRLKGKGLDQEHAWVAQGHG